MRSLALCLVVLLCLALPCHAQYASVEWREVDESQVALYLDGVQAGNLRIADGQYFPKFLDGWGEATDPPVEVPAKYRPKPSFQETGVTISKVAPQAMVGGDVDALERVKRQAEASPALKVPAYQLMESITVVSSDAVKRNAIAKDFEANPALAQWKDARVKAMDPNDPLLAPFKLAEDKRFAETGLAVIYQPAPDSTGHAPATTIYEYASAEEAAGKLRDVSESYDPNSTEYTGWTRTHVGVGVGLGVGSVFSLIFGGVLSWARLKPSLPSP